MARILHLSDLHLSTEVLNSTFGDYKSDSITPGDRLRLKEVLKWTIEKWVHSVESLGKLDAVVISGDITVRDAKDGWENFKQLLDWLNPILPEPNRIVVVPGNHDVKRDVGRNASEHYGNFVSYVRSMGFITPPLEGLDFKDYAISSDLSKHLLVDPHGGWAIIPINSSEFCGVKEPISPIEDGEWEDFLKNCRAGPVAAQAVARKLRIHDMARISWPQMCAIHTLCMEAERLAGTQQITRIGVVHHQLLPVDIAEEVKPFEAITNLGHFREVLAKNKFNIILHGHKHVGRVLVDSVAINDHGMEQPPHPIAIISSPALAYLKDPKQPLFRHLEITGAPGRATIGITDVRGGRIGTSINPQPTQLLRIFEPPKNLQLKRSAGYLIEGETLNEVYEKALTLFAGKEGNPVLQNVTCRVASGTDSLEFPTDYPRNEIKAFVDDENWFGKIVDWWQKNKFLKLAPNGKFENGVYNHGTKLFGGGAHHSNQIDNVIDVLWRDPGSSKGIATLVDPINQPINMEGCGFPSFCFVHFVLAKHGTDYYLDLIAYFRRQEIKYWWPVNYAELSILQGKVIDGIKRKLNRDHIWRGTITTIAALAKKGAQVPNIMVPEADMVLEEIGDEFWAMTYALCQFNLPERSSLLEKWDKVCSGLIPPEVPSLPEFMAPIQCLVVLSNVADPFAQHHANIQRLKAEWDAILAANREINDKHDSKEIKDYNSWHHIVSKCVGRVREIINSATSCN